MRDVKSRLLCGYQSVGLAAYATLSPLAALPAISEAAGMCAVLLIDILPCAVLRRAQHQTRRAIILAAVVECSLHLLSLARPH